MKNYTNTISVNGWVNVHTALVAATPALNANTSVVRSITVINNSASALYLHAADGTQPSTAANGVLISTAAVGAAFTLEDVDVATLWLNTGGALNVTIIIVAVK